MTSMDSDGMATATNDPSQIAWQRELLEQADVRAVSTALLALVKGAERLVQRTRLDGSGLDSRPAADLAWSENPETAEGTTHIGNAQSSSLTSVLVATDHVRAFVQGVRGGRTTVSNWTLARGAIEAIAPTHYLLVSDTAADYFRRHIELVLLETKFDRGGSYAYRYGPPISVDEYRDGFRTMARERGIMLPKQEPTLTALASALLDAAAAASDADGRRMYSHLSSVAHGQAPGIHMFIPDLGEQITLPRRLVIVAAHLQAACLLHVCDELVTYFQPPAQAVERWQQAKGLATSTFAAHKASNQTGVARTTG